MTVPKTEPAPRRNRTNAGNVSRMSGIASGDIILALGDYTGGAAENLFTLASHGLSTGDIVYVVSQAAHGVVTGGPGTRCVVTSLSSSTFTLTSDGTTAITNTADGYATFLKGTGVPQRVADIARMLIVTCLVDTTGGTVEDMNVPYSGDVSMTTGTTLKILAKSASGVHPSAVDATVYLIAPVSSAASHYFQTSLTAGGASVDTTGDGTVVYLKTS